MNIDQDRTRRIEAGRAVADTYLRTHARTRDVPEVSVEAYARQQGTPLRKVDELSGVLGRVVLMMCPSRATRASTGKVAGAERRAQEDHAHNMQVRAAWSAAVRSGEIRTLTEVTPLDLSREQDRARLRVIAKRRRAVRLKLAVAV